MCPPLGAAGSNAYRPGTHLFLSGTQTAFFGQVTANHDPLPLYRCTCVYRERPGELNSATVTAMSRLGVSGLPPFQVAESIVLWDLLRTGRRGYSDRQAGLAGTSPLGLLRSPDFVQEFDIGIKAYLI